MKDADKMTPDELIALAKEKVSKGPTHEGVLAEDIYYHNNSPLDECSALNETSKRIYEQAYPFFVKVYSKGTKFRRFETYLQGRVFAYWETDIEPYISVDLKSAYDEESFDFGGEEWAKKNLINIKPL